MPVATFRAWTIGLVWAIIIPGLNQFFFFRYPSVTVNGVRALDPLMLVFRTLITPCHLSTSRLWLSYCRFLLVVSGHG